MGVTNRAGIAHVLRLEDGVLILCGKTGSRRRSYVDEAYTSVIVSHTTPDKTYRSGRIRRAKAAIGEKNIAHVHTI